MEIKWPNKELRRKRKISARRQWHRKFSLKPKRISTEKILWLEFYWTKEVQQNRYPHEWYFVYETDKEHFIKKITE